MSIEEWEKKRVEREKRVLATRSVIWEAMKSLKIAKIEARYYGGGDSGQFEEFYAFANEDDKDVTEENDDLTKKIREHKVTFKDEVAEYVEGDEGRRYVESIKDITKPLEEAVEVVANTLLDWTHAGWEINEGGSGTCVFTLSSKEIRLNHESYFTQSEHHENVWTEEA